jgi:hypothetical protein
VLPIETVAIALPSHGLPPAECLAASWAARGTPSRDEDTPREERAMETLAELWLPIVLSAVFVFVVSSLVHMVLQIHKGDFRRLPDEEKLLADLRAHGVGPGAYMFPHCGSMKEMSTPEFQALQKQGPMGSLIVLPAGGVSMGRSLVQWFLYSLAVSAVVAHIAHSSLPHGTHYTHVFHVVALSAFLGYGVSSATDSIWKGISWGTTLKFMFDGVLYALVTAGTFGWLWPAAA